ncbi:MAG: 30S ribosomal protein S7 [Candidatus Bathyarchaeia archaeon]
MRRPVKTKRTWVADPVYNSIAVTRFVNNLMRDGKKSKAQKIFYQALDHIKTKNDQDGFKIFQEALKNVSPVMKVMPRRIGGATYLVPRVVRNEERFTTAVKWLIQAARSRTGQPMYSRLADELIAAAKHEGVAVKKKEDSHKLAEVNRAFAHYAWWGRKRSTHST